MRNIENESSLKIYSDRFLTENGLVFIGFECSARDWNLNDPGTPTSIARREHSNHVKKVHGGRDHVSLKFVFSRPLYKSSLNIRN